MEMTEMRWPFAATLFEQTDMPQDGITDDHGREGYAGRIVLYIPNS